MVKFNTHKKGITKTVNHEGAEAYKPSQKLELMLRTMSFMMNGDAYYTTEKETSGAIASLVKSISTTDPQYVLNLAVFAREEMYLRSVPVFLLVEYAKTGAKLPGAYKYVPKILQRADEPAEALSYLFASAKRSPESDEKRRHTLKMAGKPVTERTTAPIPKMLKRGIAETLNKFDAYQLAKYNREGSVTLKDVLLLTHPKPKSEEQQEIFDKIVAGTLEPPFTWEVVISTKGSTKETWESVIPKMGYMATLRNLRNLVEKGVDLDPVIARLTNPIAVANSKQFPYRFFSAYKALAYGPCFSFSYNHPKNDAPTKLLDALNVAMDLSVANVDNIPGKTFVATDNSGSMNDSIETQYGNRTRLRSTRSNISRIDVASLLSAISLHICDEAKVGAFANVYTTVPLSKKSTILDNMQKIRNTAVGGATNAWLAIDHIIRKEEFYDRIFLFSDMQCYNSYEYSDNYESDLASCVREYRKKINPKCRLYSFDMSSYGLLKFPEHDPLTCPLSGYSDAIFRFVPMFEQDKTTMLKSIESYKPL